MVMRLEKIKSTDIEEAGGKKVIQYRGRSLVLFTLNEMVQVKPLVDKKEYFVIIFIIAGREFGLLASSIVDIIEMSVDMDDSPLKQPGIAGSLNIDKHTTLIIDVFTLIQTLSPEWFSKKKVMKTSDEELQTILIAEDSKFFRKQIKVLLECEGYNVFEAEDGMAAWDLLHKHPDEISLVLTDIEMPNLDGLELTKKIREDKNYSHLPVISLSTLDGDEDIARGKEAGVDDYQIKLDEEKLLRGINDLLREKGN